MAEANRSGFISHAEYGSSGKLLLKVLRGYGGPWSLAADAGADAAADADVEPDPFAEADAALDIDAEVADEAADYVGAETGGEDDEPPEEKPEETIDDEPPEEKPKRSDKRIKGLLKDREDLRAEMAQGQEAFQYQVRQMQTHFAQQQTAAAEADKRNAVLAKELELIRRQQDIRDDENLEPAERLRRDAVREGVETSRQEMEPRLTELRDELLQLKSGLHERDQRAKQDERLDGYLNDARAAVTEHLEGAEAKFQTALGPGGRHDSVRPLMNWCATTGELPRDAIKNFDKWARIWVAAQSGVSKKRNAERLKRGKNTPAAPPGARRSARGGRRMPTLEEIQKPSPGHPDGFQNHLEWIAAQDDSDSG